MTDQQPIIEICSASFRYPGNSSRQYIFEDLSLEIAPGESVALLGPNGCGKTTLLHVAFGLYRSSQGMIKFKGNIVEKPLDKGCLVFQSDALLPWRTVLENVCFPLEVHVMSREEKKQLAMDALQELGIADAYSKYINQLSGGMRQRVALARALVTMPEVLFLDEPYSALDAPTREYLQEEIVLERLRRKLTIVIVTHDVDEAVFLADRSIIFSAERMRVAAEILSPFPRERAGDIRKSEEFSKLRSRLWGELREVCQPNSKR